ncbi:hypothetical protein K1T71_009990 [Dendrolimus kikuchii]|uniref:Uncharacterized protein n=1 Tax=Dendrolimus kikuchii TaxID=765133 RepID=A0ACC1CUF7_9NEOP|nr:hypothetical protein K1T71_009990 [Dendrolimus kikuchii]
MGKRKYNNDKDSPRKKKKTGNNSDNDVGEQPQNVEISDNFLENLPKNLSFDIKHFRKELTGKQGQTMALTQFLQVCLNPDSEIDYLLAYLKIGGNSHEILRQINNESKKNMSLATPAFHLFHLIILKVQSTLPHMIPITEEACRYFLNTFMSTVEIMISENSAPRHRKIILKLLTSMVTLNPDLGIEVLNQAPLTPKHLQHVVEKPNYKEKDNVRTTFVHFMTSFLIDGHPLLIKALLEKQGLLALVIPGLVHDEAEAVLMFLNILKKNVIENNLISKSLKLKTFSHQVLHNMFKIFSWKGPQELSEVRNELRPEIMNLITNIILMLFTSHRLGLYFIDNSLGTADSNKNQNLYKALLTLKRPWENEYEQEVILQIVYKCPDLHRAIINVIEQSFEPQHSPIWERTTEFFIKLLDSLKPEEMVPRMSNLNPSQIANFVRFVTLPVPLLKYIQTTLGKNQTLSLYCVKVLVKMLQMLRRYLQILEVSDMSQVVELKNKLEYFFPKHLPAPSWIVLVTENVINNKGYEEKDQGYKLPKINDTDALIYLIDLLLLYNDIHPTLFETLEGTIDMKKILEYSNKLSDSKVSLLKFKIVSLWLTLDSSVISLKNKMFKELFLIMLDVYMSDDDTWIESKDTLITFFKNTSIFEGDEDEIHLMLYTLRNAKVSPSSLIGDIVEYILKNVIDLTEYVKNQLVNFEISDENNQTCLDKMFDDLIENRNIDSSVFLENKVPSPFIVGCMQYVQINKEIKKSLKPFLSLYIANLLHSNYTPELTEVLIGDSKLDIRNYVASWIGQPTSLPENLLTDNVLSKISKSVINNEVFAIQDIFPQLVEPEDGDLIINNKTYNIDIMENVDNSELIIWTKYLIFCTVRLSIIDQLRAEQQNKINDYIQCLIKIARKHHLIDVCRTIIVMVFKNPHVLKLFRPLDINKSESYLLPTNFLLQLINDNKDIIKYLNNKQKLLKAYEQKNYSELIKAFIKINKRKNVNSTHTVQVLEVIGLTNEDDLHIFNQIFTIDISACSRDDREPSIVLEVLRYLVEKYSKLTVDLPPHVLRKTMKLYTDLLINKDLNVNLTNLEISLTQYFEYKAYQATKITEDIFKKFFIVNVTRKTTSQLASILLKSNLKLCNVFKEQIANKEILSQRELTLPLGNAVVDHYQFLIQNKDFLTNIFNEYKSNVNKMLEKPHKAGQIYVNNWKFISKLIFECMDTADCAKLFEKMQKYETIELSHINLVQSAFLKLCLNKDVLKKDHIINYILTLLNSLVLAFKDDKDFNTVNELVLNLNIVVKVSKYIDFFHTENKDIFKRVIESATWQNFCKAVLKDSLKRKTAGDIGTTGPKLLSLLSELVKLFYPKEHEDITSLFDMVTSHSEFLNVMLSYHSIEIKSRLVEFLYTLIRLNNTVMKTQQIPVYLSSYHATRNPCDRLLLAILFYYENNGLPVNEYKPYVWGDSAANYYAVRKNRSASLWSHPTPNRVLNLFEKDIIENTVRNFPVNQKLDYNYDLKSYLDDDERHNGSVKTILDEMVKQGVFKATQIKDTEGSVKNLVTKAKYDEDLQKLKKSDVVSSSHTDLDETIYDPVFLFPLLSHLLAPGSVASCFKLLRMGILSVPVMALSSNCPLMRAAAYHVLHRFCLLLETETRHKNDKLFLNDFINTLRQSLSTAIINSEDCEDFRDFKNPKLPAIDALYLAKALMVSTAPFDPLYKPVNNFLIAKEFVDLTVVPDFLSLFHDSDVEAAERRLWVLDIIKDGTKTMTDVNIIYKTMCLKMIMDYYSSVLSDKKSKQKILTAISSVAAIPRSCEILLEGYGLISWLHSIVRHLGKDRSLIIGILNLITNVVQSMKLNSFTKSIAAKSNARNGKVHDVLDLKINKEVEFDLLIIVYDLISVIDDLEMCDVLNYMKIYKLFSNRSIKCLTKKQMFYIVDKVGVFVKYNDGIKIVIKALSNNSANMLKSKLLYESMDDLKDCLMREMVDVVTKFII